MKLENRTPPYARAAQNLNIEMWESPTDRLTGRDDVEDAGHHLAAHHVGGPAQDRAVVHLGLGRVAEEGGAALVGVRLAGEVHAAGGGVERPVEHVGLGLSTVLFALKKFRLGKGRRLTSGKASTRQEMWAVSPSETP